MRLSRAPRGGGGTGSGAAAPLRPPGGKRLRVAAAAVAYVLAGLPVWWLLTSLHRPQLPLAAMASAGGSTPPLPPLTVEAYAVLPPGAAEGSAAPAAAALLAALRAQLQQGEVREGPLVSTWLLAAAYDCCGSRAACCGRRTHSRDKAVACTLHA